MSVIDQMELPVAKELGEFKNGFSDSFKHSDQYINSILKYILSSKGKGMRPLLVFLSTKFSGNISRSTHTAASLIELIHVASLAHDDVVDEAYRRRGEWNVNALWRSKVAILIGDLILSKAVNMALSEEEYAILKKVGRSLEDMSEGELIQIGHANKLDTTTDSYYQIIGKKTATLLSSCAWCGAASASASHEHIDAMGEFGWLIGIAFQIKDDILDYQAKNEIGKPQSQDLKEGKITLPLLYLLNNSDKAEKGKLLSLLSQAKYDDRALYKIHEKVVKEGGIEYAQQEMKKYKQKALNILSTLQGDDEARKSLELFADYVIDRKK